MDSLKNRNLQLLAIVLCCLSVTTTSMSVIISPTGLNLSGVARIALPLGLLLLLVGEYPRFKTTAARIPFLAIGSALCIMTVCIWIFHIFFK
jgi:hypothetical protein